MCNFASFVLTKDEAIIDENGLQNLDKPPIRLVRVEVTPPREGGEETDYV